MEVQAELEAQLGGAAIPHRRSREARDARVAADGAVEAAVASEEQEDAAALGGAVVRADTSTSSSA